ncbi:hypothetical protein L1887_21957 [Cichorium endivia]|nr:hypothetical protein L1887_21957 [Cichorium endivia]
MEGSIIVSLPTEQSKGTNPGHPDNHYPLPNRNHLPTNQSDQTACYNRISNSREHDAVSRRGPDTPDQHEVASSPQPGFSPPMLRPFYTKTLLSRSHCCQGPELKRNTIVQRSPRLNGNNQNSYGSDHASLAWPRSLPLRNTYNLQQLH